MNLNKAFRQALLDFDPDDFSILSATQSPLDRPARIPTGFTQASASWDKYKPVPQRDVEVVAMEQNTMPPILNNGAFTGLRTAIRDYTPTALDLAASAPTAPGQGAFTGLRNAAKEAMFNAMPSTPVAVIADAPHSRSASDYSAWDSPPLQPSGNYHLDLIKRMEAGDNEARDEALLLYDKSDAFRQIYHQIKGGEPKGVYAQKTPPAATQEPAVETTSPWYRKPYAMYGGLGAGALGAGVIGYNMMSQPTEEEEFYSSPGYGAMPRSFAMG